MVNAATGQVHLLTVTMLTPYNAVNMWCHAVYCVVNSLHCPLTELQACITAARQVLLQSASRALQHNSCLMSPDAWISCAADMHWAIKQPCVLPTARMLPGWHVVLAAHCSKSLLQCVPSCQSFTGNSNSTGMRGMLVLCPAVQ